MASRDINEELNMVLKEAEEADRHFEIQETLLDQWLEKFGVDVWATKPMKQIAEDGGEIVNGLHYPKEQELRDPMQIKRWANTLYRDKLNLIVQNPEITSDQLRAILSTMECHSDFLKYYPYIFDILTKNPMEPPYYRKILNHMCDARQRIRNGEDVDYVEAELQAYFMKYKDQHKK